MESEKMNNFNLEESYLLMIMFSQLLGGCNLINESGFEK